MDIYVVVEGAAVGAKVGVPQGETMIGEVTGLNVNGHTNRVNPALGFENYQWFNIPEETHLQLTHMRKDYQRQNIQCTDAGSRTNSQCK